MRTDENLPDFILFTMLVFVNIDLLLNIKSILPIKFESMFSSFI